ncbi:prenyltransferase [Caldisphaera lagunensis]|nr:prenyltransferase [Caldisphaera lagunensis]
MSKVRIKQIVMGSRPWALPMFIATYSIGVFTGFYYYKLFGLYLVLLIIIGAVGELLIHMMTNIINDYYDYIKGIDKANNTKRYHLILNSNLDPKDVKNISLILGIIGLLIGIFIAIMGRPWALLLGFIGFLLGLEYSAPPLYLKYYALGDFSVIISMLLLTLAGFYMYTGKISIVGILIGLPISLLIDDVLMANNIRDINRDKTSGAKTLSIILGYNKSKYLYISFIILSYTILAFLIIFKIYPIYVLIEVLTLPQAINIIKDALNNNFDFLDVKNAKLVSNFGILFVISLIIYIIIKII